MPTFNIKCPPKYIYPDWQANYYFLAAFDICHGDNTGLADACDACACDAGCLYLKVLL